MAPWAVARVSRSGFSNRKAFEVRLISTPSGGGFIDGARGIAAKILRLICGDASTNGAFIAADSDFSRRGETAD
jgi:hypothetical protein